jgi:hypothetical protein
VIKNQQDKKRSFKIGCGLWKLTFKKDCGIKDMGTVKITLNCAFLIS